MKDKAKEYFKNSKHLFSDQKDEWWKDAVIDMLAEFAEQQVKNCSIPAVIGSFSLPELWKMAQKYNCDDFVKMAEEVNRINDL